MPPEAGPLGTPLAWLRRAKSNLARAKQPKPDEAVWEDLYFDAKQAAEKALKWRPHALNVNGRVFVPARPAWIDQELDVDALLIHVADASIDVSAVTPARTF